jgi:hypothetical protein
MITVQIHTALKEIDFQEHILHTLEVVLDQYEEWKEVRHAIGAQIAFDFQLAGPDVDQAGDAMQQIHLLADVLRYLAYRIEEEVEETMDLWHTWLTD